MRKTQILCQLQDGNFREYSDPARVTNKSKPPVYIKFLFALFVQPCPLPVHVLHRAPFKSWDLDSELHTMGMAWGSRSDYEEREDLIQSLRLRPRGYTYINTTESVSDFSLLASVRHDFYWLDVMTYNDHIRFTPQVSFTSGTQKFGFNQKSNTYGTSILNSTNILYSSENLYLDDQLDFQPLSLSVYMRGEYSIGKFFVQPQFLLDYYFPAPDNNLTTLFSVNIGIVL